jgi:hypothetical protein
LLLTKGLEKDARSVLRSIYLEIVYIYNFLDSTLLVILDYLRIDVKEGLGVREVEYHEETIIMTTLVTKE